ncbi:AAA family ATPase [Caballeronia ptereochthonis]|uniref:ATPase n=1 Tax=Caballeronia ptereochthonis TaxID=1777144 RepID=A0A158C8B5_9BURK|nr:AAA family ATPase [Caballeronia ptereochthonis]SAK78532.1 ATPase [Caballeronia ptereochthonis]
MNRFVVVSGCSGAGKSTLLAELSRRGFATVEEPGRRIVQAEMQHDGNALPWLDMSAFLHRAIDMAHADRASFSEARKWVFFDRGLIDAASGLEHLSGKPYLSAPGLADAYHRHVFMTPPWPEIFVQDDERRHEFQSAHDEYVRLVSAYRKLGYDVSMLPKTDVAARADFVLDALAAWRL